jgi:hypothetical protein
MSKLLILACCLVAASSIVHAGDSDRPPPPPPLPADLCARTGDVLFDTPGSLTVWASGGWTRVERGPDGVVTDTWSGCLTAAQVATVRSQRSRDHVVTLLGDATKRVMPPCCKR